MDIYDIDVTYRDLTAVDDYLQDRVLLIGVKRGQVVERGVNRPINPLSELTGQVSGLSVLKLTVQYVLKELWDNNQRMNTFKSVYHILTNACEDGYIYIYICSC